VRVCARESFESLTIQRPPARQRKGLNSPHSAAISSRVVNVDSSTKFRVAISVCVDSILSKSVATVSWLFSGLTRSARLRKLIAATAQRAGDCHWRGRKRDNRWFRSSPIRSSLGLPAHAAQSAVPTHFQRAISRTYISRCL
jgi:hypothetical protein